MFERPPVSGSNGVARHGDTDRQPRVFPSPDACRENTRVSLVTCPVFLSPWGSQLTLPMTPRPLICSYSIPGVAVLLRRHPKSSNKRSASVSQLASGRSPVSRSRVPIMPQSKRLELSPDAIAELAVERQLKKEQRKAELAREEQDRGRILSREWVTLQEAPGLGQQLRIMTWNVCKLCILCTRPTLNDMLSSFWLSP